MSLVIGGGAPPSSVTDPWSSAGPAYTNPRPATDLLMSAYDTGQSDPTADMQTALNAAGAVAQTTGRARLLLDSRLHYVLAGAPSVRTDKQYAALSVPADLTRRQVFVEIVGIPGTGCVPMNTGSVGGGGTIIEGTYNTLISWSATDGLPSLIGGPSFKAAGGGRTNAETSSLNLGLKNVTIRVPNDSPMAGVDASGMQGFEADNCVWDTPQWASFSGGPGVWTGQAIATRANAIGLLTPGINGQENSRIGHIYVSGYRCAVYLNELCIAERIDANANYLLFGLGVGYHPSRIGVIGDYNNANGAGGYNPGTGANVIQPDASPAAYFLSSYWDKQPGDSQMASAFNRTYDVYDPGNVCPIKADIVRVDANVGRVNGGHVVYGAGGLNGFWSGRLNDLTSPRQARGAPSMPSSTTTLRNPFWQDSLVTVTGGTFTDVKVNGISSGTGGTYLVPASASISITYSVAPTWAWQGI